MIDIDSSYSKVQLYYSFTDDTTNSIVYEKTFSLPSIDTISIFIIFYCLIFIIIKNN